MSYVNNEKSLHNRTFNDVEFAERKKIIVAILEKAAAAAAEISLPSALPRHIEPELDILYGHVRPNQVSGETYIVSTRDICRGF